MRLLNVFRDETDLSVSPNLWKTIEQTLDNSDHFILLASPQAAKSKWVKMEVEYWLKNKSAKSILLAVTEGELSWNSIDKDFDWDRTTAVPSSLRGKFTAEPNYADFRSFRGEGGHRLKNFEFQYQVLKIASRILNKSIKDISGEEVRQQRRIKAIGFIVAILFTVLLGGLGITGFVATKKASESVFFQRQSSAHAHAEASVAQADTNTTAALQYAIRAFEMAPDNSSAILSGAICNAYYSSVLNNEPVYQKSVDVGDFLRTISFTKEKNVIAVTSNSSGVHILSTSGTVITRLDFDDYVRNALFIEDGNRLIVEDSNNNLYFYDTQTWERLDTVQIETDSGPQSWVAHKKRIFALDRFPDTIISINIDGKIDYAQDLELYSSARLASTLTNPVIVSLQENNEFFVLVFPTNSCHSDYAATAAISSNATGLLPSFAECLLFRL